jgi:succinyl-diaminopimelate desuccinylase
MTTGRPAVAEAGAPPVDSIVALAQRLVRIPSRGGEDVPGSILGALKTWLEENSVAAELLRASDGAPVAVVGAVGGSRPGPTYCLDACIDTAPFGDPSTWRRPPTSGHIEHGYLNGRGAADSKMGAAIFAHVAADLAAGADGLAGTLLVLFDADEHTGRFGGARAFLERHPDVAGVMIGYPGRDAVGVGARGFFRATLHVGGVAAHSGSSTQHGTNAIEKASLLVEMLRREKLPKPTGAFPHPPSLTVTAIAGGDGFSTVPDLCSVKVDLRLTPTFNDDSARELLRACAARVDSEVPTPTATRLEEHETWPAYRVAEDEPVAGALLAAAREQLDGPVEARVAGPSNIGNLCAAHGVPATCGFGVEAVNVHAANEAAGIDHVEVVFSAYRAAVAALLRG